MPTPATAWSQAGPTQAPFSSIHPSETEHDHPQDGQAVVDLLNQPTPLDEEEVTANPPDDFEVPNPFQEGEDTINQGMWSDLASLAHMTPSFPSWGWADSV